MDAFLLSNKVALVTGAGRGIGAACATMLSEAGASVAVLDLDAASAETRAEAIRARGARAIAIGCDVTDAGALERAFARVIGELGGLDVLVNDAGIAIRVPATQLALEDWHTIRRAPTTLASLSGV